MDRLRQLARNKRIRKMTMAMVIVLTLGIFAYYLMTRPETLSALLGLDPLTLTLLSIMYLFTIAVNAFVLWVSLKLIRKPVRYSENIALTGYSSIVNFFGPLQSGPGFRAAYLKTKHGVSVKSFFYVTLVFYGFFATLNGLVILGSVIAISNIVLIGVISIVVVSFATVAFLLISKQPKLQEALRQVRLNDRYFWMIGLGALLLSITTAGAYFVELRHVDPSISVTQTIVYTAAANLALFVSLTPGAIGFRESFILLSQQLHGISTDTVVAASIIDRAFYVVFLLVLFLILVAVGARSRLQRSESR